MSTSSPLPASPSAAENIGHPAGLLSAGLPLGDLFQLFFKRVHQLYALDCAAVVLYDQDIERISATFSCHYGEEKGAVLTHNSGTRAFDSISRAIATSAFAVLKTDDDWREQFASNHCLPNGNDAYQYHCYLPLEVNSELVGTVELHNYSSVFSTSCLAYCSSFTDIFADSLIRAGQIQDNTVVAQTELADAGEPHLHALRHAQAMIEQQRKEIDRYKAQLACDETEADNSGETEPLATNTFRGEMVGEGLEMQRVYTLIGQVAHSDTTVLILGETGTGKELIAKAVHQHSPRHHQVMVKVNCAAIPPNLIESELFGHEKGSFTGATERRLGKFEMAHKSTIFLDEVGELSIELQVKLLRVLQEKEIERVGGRTMIPTDVRIIAATNRDLLKEVEAGRFRSDLFYRLHVFPIILPPLRDRKNDIPGLAMHFLSIFNLKASRHVEGFSKHVLQEMMRYSWPGNVRELEHLVEREVLLCRGKVIKSIDLPLEANMLPLQRKDSTVVKTILENERDHIFEVLQRCKGKVSGKDGAAKLLGVPSTTLSSKIKKLALSKKHLY